MKYVKSIVVVLLLAAAIPQSSYAQRGLEAVLLEIENNNPSLAARRKLTEAEIIDAKTGNSLEDPEVEYARAWGHPSELGKTGELTVTQSFDFPTLYANRSKLAKLKARQYGLEYAAYRQELLLEANILCVEIIAMKEKDGYLRAALDDASTAVGIIEKRMDAGDANALEESKAKFEYLNVLNIVRMNEVELAAAESRLAAMNAGKPIDLTHIDLSAQPEIPDYETALRRYEESYPELQSVVMQLNIAQQDVKVNKAQSLPKMKLGYKNEHAKGERFNGIVVGMSIPMFGNKNNVKSAKARNTYAESELKRAKNDLESTISELYAKEKVLRNAVDEYSSLVNKDVTTALLTKALDAGHISLIDYFSQLQPIYETHVSIAEARKEHRVVCAMINMLDL